MADLDLVTYCGLYCGLCAQKCRIPKRARELRDALQTEGYDQWASCLPGFDEFWKFLNGLLDLETKCTCRAGDCGDPGCTIRKCARDKKIDVCVNCDEYPCNRVEGIAKGYPNLIADGKRMQKIGIDAWIEEQRQRVKTGFAYSDIRCYPYEVPNE